MSAFVDRRCDYPEITSLFSIMDEQQQRIQEANTLKYLAAVGLEEIYRKQDLALSLYGYLEDIRNYTGKSLKTRKRYIKNLMRRLSGIIPDKCIFNDDVEVILEMCRSGLLLLCIDFIYENNTYRLSVPNVASIKRIYFMDGDVWIEKASPCIWAMDEYGNRDLIVSSMSAEMLRTRFNTFLKERKKQNG